MGSAQLVAILEQFQHAEEEALKLYRRIHTLTGVLQRAIGERDTEPPPPPSLPELPPTLPPSVPTIKGLPRPPLLPPPLPSRLKPSGRY